MSQVVHEKSMEIRKIPLSIDTVCRTFAKISDDQFQQLITILEKNPKFTIQLHEMTDVSNIAQLQLYVLYVHKESSEEELFFVVFWSATPEVKICSIMSIKFRNYRFAMGKLH